VTRRWFQMMIPSTAGDATSTYFKLKVSSGRRASELDSGYGTAYLEFSADDKAPGFDPGDEKMWAKMMPALGHTQTVETLRAIYQKFVLDGKLNIWLRAFLNVWVDRVSDPVFPAGSWEACANAEAERATRPILAIDVSADRKHACIAIAAQTTDGVNMIRVVDYRPGTDWVVNRVLELRETYELIEVVADSIGPVRSLVVDLANEYVEVRETTTNELVAACGLIYDAVKQGAVVHFSDPSLELAVVNAETRTLGDAWAWTRRKSAEETDTDISPLVACTLAHWGQVKFGDDINDKGGW
jgi:phage terminase large subunit-like protein